MKFFVQILTIYFIVMAFTPSDHVMGICCTPSPTESHETCHSESKDSDKDKKDCCKDYCACASFGTLLSFFPEKEINEPSVIPPFYVENNFPYQSITGLELTSGIWQPPRLS